MAFRCTDSAAKARVNCSGRSGLESTPTSNAPEARRASPSLTSARNCKAASSICTASLPRPRSRSARALRITRFDFLDRQRLEFEHPAAADQSAGEREERILRRRADEDHDAFFHVRQQHILLGAVEAVDFVDEQQRLLPARREPVAGLVQHLAQFLDAAGHGAQLLESAARGRGQEHGQRGLAGAGRAVKNHRPQPIGGQQPAQQFPFAQKMLLADEFVERSRPHPRCQRLRPPPIRRFRRLEE